MAFNNRQRLTYTTEEITRLDVCRNHDSFNTARVFTFSASARFPLHGDNASHLNLLELSFVSIQLIHIYDVPCAQMLLSHDKMDDNHIDVQKNSSM